MRTLAVLLTAFALHAQAPPVLEYQGKPLRIPTTCTAETMQALGMECSEARPCPLFVELSAIESSGTRQFLTGNIHTSDTTLESILLVTEDGGKTWHEPLARIRGGGLDQIVFADIETGWISGQLLGSPPRDPFFLLTTDGGKTWRKRAVYPESRTGAIESFWFEGRTRGIVLLDRVQTGGEGGRYEMYETMTGGEGWTLRQVAREPITARRPASAEPAERIWRIQTDAHAKAYRIEKRTTAGWQTVASFLIEAGACGTPPADPPGPSLR